MIWATLSRTRDRRRGGGHTALTSLEGAFLAGEVLETANVVDVISALIDELAGTVLDEVLDKGEGLEGWRGGWDGESTLKICLHCLFLGSRVFQMVEQITLKSSLEEKE